MGLFGKDQPYGSPIPESLTENNFRGLINSPPRWDQAETGSPWGHTLLGFFLPRSDSPSGRHGPAGATFLCQEDSRLSFCFGSLWAETPHSLPALTLYVCEKWKSPHPLLQGFLQSLGKEEASTLPLMVQEPLGALLSAGRCQGEGRNNQIKQVRNRTTSCSEAQRLENDAKILRNGFKLNSPADSLHNPSRTTFHRFKLSCPERSSLCWAFDSSWENYTTA